MNAAEQANSIEMVSKIATIINLFRSEFPDILADLKPWVQNAETEQLGNPHSIDLAFYFRQGNFACQSDCILMQIRLPRNTKVNPQRTIGIELSGHNYMGQHWRFATTGRWEFWGTTLPLPDVQQKLRQMCLQVLQLFERVTINSTTER